MSDELRDFFYNIDTIKLREPLAETLGAFKQGEGLLEYSFIETVKMAGHACPTVSGAWLCCQEALHQLYPDETPERGGIEITIYGEADEGVYGVMGQVFSFVTGAAPISGFKGLGSKYARRNLLKFSSEKRDPEAMSFQFKRLDNGTRVLVRFYPQRVPAPPENGVKIQTLMKKVLGAEASNEEKRELQDLFIAKVELMLVERKDMGHWLVLDKR